MHSASLSLGLILAFLVLRSVQVDIIIYGEQTDMYDTAICPRQPPGVCCRAPSRGNRYRNITFRHLLPGDIAAVFWEELDWHIHQMRGWMVDGSSDDLMDIVRGCRTPIVKIGYGPGTFVASRSDETPFGAGSYISLGDVKTPPDPTTISFLNFQGVAGLVWGGGQWFASAAAQSKFGSGGGLMERRRIMSPLKGTAFILPPPRWVYPSLVEVNGTEYTSEDTRTLVYRTPIGEQLNLTKPSLE